MDRIEPLSRTNGVSPKSGLSKNSTHKKHQLVILDMNGLLCMKVPNNSNYLPPNPEVKTIKIKNYILYIRPGIRDFMNRLLKIYKVAIFSSTTEKNLISSLGVILGNQIMKRLVFIWDRSRTRHDPDYRMDRSIKSHQTIKALKDVWENPIINPWKFWNKTNTICIDHDYMKLRFNKSENIIISQEWGIKLTKDKSQKLPELEEIIKRKFDQLAD
uniref:Ctd-like (NLI interacting factor-like) phosphatase n=1 Tax=Pithovirus LCPAC201 TaxID=2506591 RepID=A0A481Z5M6_9VIRU|nr:MAG: ctd-like (NLI interacting factor-like) phosphatase [Pithovirus LCPAC201]